MKITRIEKFPLNLKIVKTGYRRKDDLNAMVSTIIIRVNTDKDISGLGEAATTRSYFNQTIGTMQDWLVAYEQVLIGEDPRDIIKIHHKMDLVSGERAPGCHPTRAAIDMAIYDIIGKIYSFCIYRIDRAQVFFCLPIFLILICKNYTNRIFNKDKTYMVNFDSYMQ